MTFKKLWKFITTKLIWLTCWNGKSEPLEEIKEILTNSLLIPKPKFKVGEVCRETYNPRRKVYIEFLAYSPQLNMWVYENMSECGVKHYEDELELVETAE